MLKRLFLDFSNNVHFSSLFPMFQKVESHSYYMTKAKARGEMKWERGGRWQLWSRLSNLLWFFWTTSPYLYTWEPIWTGWRTGTLTHSRHSLFWLSCGTMLSSLWFDCIIMLMMIIWSITLFGDMLVHPTLLPRLGSVYITGIIISYVIMKESYFLWQNRGSQILSTI